MTLIAAIKDEKGIHFVSDSRVTYEGGAVYDVCNKWKVIRKRSSKSSKILIGCAGSSRLDSLIASTTSAIASASSAYEIADILKRAIILDAWRESKDEGGEPQSYSVDILLIFEKKLYRVGSDLSVTEIPDFVFVAVGSGEPYALGCSFTIKGKPAKTVLRMSVQAAIKFDPSCGGKIQYGLLEY